MLQKQFSEIIFLIKQARTHALIAVNRDLINLYWNVGEYISRKIATSNWGEGTINQLSELIEKEHPDLKGFNRRGLYRMKQFYETYTQSKFVSSAMTQIQLPENLAEYKTKLPDKKLLQQKLHEIFENRKEIS